MPLLTVAGSGQKLKIANYRQWLYVVDRNNYDYRAITLSPEPLKRGTVYHCSVYVLARSAKFTKGGNPFGIVASPGMNRLDILGEATPAQIEEYRLKVGISDAKIQSAIACNSSG